MAAEPKKSPDKTAILPFGRGLGSAPQAIGRTDSRPSEDAVKLAAKLRARASADDRIFMFAGVVDRDGATEAAWEVAQAMAQSSPGEVLLVDADLRQPTLHRYCDAAVSPGLAESIRMGITDPAAIHVAHSVSVLPAGGASECSPLLCSAEFHSVLDGLKQQYRWIVVAGPPVLEGADAGLIAGCSDGVVLIVSAGKNRKRELLAAKRDLDSLRVSLVGVVLYQS